MDRELQYLLLTKVGFALAILPWVIAAFIGTVSGYPAAAILLASLAGAAIWGYSYGVLSELSE